MQKKTKPALPQYLRILKSIREMIDSDYKDGGKLPTTREMCKRYDVCIATYRKAFEILQRECIIRVVGGRTGTLVVPERERIKKIGFIVNDGEKYTFLGADSGPIPLLNALYQRRCRGIHFITFSTPEELHAIQLQYFISIFVWCGPSKSILKLKNIPDVPVYVVDVFPNKLDAWGIRDTFPCLTASLGTRFRKLAEYAKQKTTGKILYGASFGPSSYYGTILRDEFAKTGIHLEEKDFIDLADPKKNLLEKIRKSKCSLLIAEANAFRYEKFFKHFDRLAPEERPKLILLDTYTKDELAKLKNMHPELIALFRHSNQSLAKIAADRVADYVQFGTPVAGEEIDFTVLEEINNQ